MTQKPFALQFVCLGNICRSPLAEGIFRSLLAQRKLEKQFEVDSTGTGHWHEGEGAHRESQRIAQKNGISLADHVARQVSATDISRIDLFVAMDRSNKQNLLSLAGKKIRVCCLREYDNEADSLDVPDPFYGGSEGFVQVFAMIDRSCRQLLESLIAELSQK